MQASRRPHNTLSTASQNLCKCLLYTGTAAECWRPLDDWLAVTTLSLGTTPLLSITLQTTPHSLSIKHRSRPGGQPKLDFSVSAVTESTMAYVHQNRNRNWASSFGQNWTQLSETFAMGINANHRHIMQIIRQQNNRQTVDSAHTCLSVWLYFSWHFYVNN